MSNEIKSLHKFLFPFRWKLNDKYNTISALDEVVNLINKPFWRKFKYEPVIDDMYNTYNESSYFYEYVRDVLNLGSNQNMVNGYQFVYSGVNENSTYNIHIKSKTSIQLSLKLDEIYLNLYENGVGIISFHLINTEIEDFNLILKINEYGRRIYPQFLGHNYPFTSDTKDNFLADKIVLKNISHENGIQIEEDFSYYDVMSNLKNNTFILPAHIQNLLGQNFGTNSNLSKCTISPILDDRMYVLSYLIDSKKIKDLSNFDKEKNQYDYSSSSEWYRYLFVDDSSPSCTSQTLMNEQLLKHTNDRWIGSTDINYSKHRELHYIGQLFGLSRYSFVMIVGDSYFNKNIVSKHFSYIYFQIAQLCLLQRAYIINFGGEVAKISNQLTHNSENINKSKKQISSLYLNYIKFVNRIYFREISPQEQGIELYNKLQNVMRIKEDVDDLDKEIQELNTYVETYSQGQLSDVAAWFLPVTLLAGVLGMNTIENFQTAYERGFSLTNIDWQFSILMLFTIIIIFWTLFVFTKQFNIIKNIKIWIKNLF